MSRVSRVRYFLSVIGLGLMAYVAYKGWLNMAYLGLVLGFVAGFMIDASAREKSLGDNLAMAIFLGGVMAYIDVHAGITAMVRDHIGQGFILAAVALAIMALIGSLMDEVRVGRTVRISYLPTVAMILALLVLFQAVSVNTDVSYTRTSYFDVSDTVTIYDSAKFVNATSTDTPGIAALPVINGTKAVTFATSLPNATLAYVAMAIYTIKNTTRVRHAGNFSMTFTLTPAAPGVKTVWILMYDESKAIIHKIAITNIDYNATSGVGHVEYALSSVDVYYANLAFYVGVEIDVESYATSSVTVAISSMAIHGQKVLDRTMAYASLVLEAIAALLAMPEDVSRHVRRPRRRRRR